jgi:hypothetical protein
MQFDRQIVLTATIFFIAFTTSTLLFVFFIRYVTYINDFSFDNNKVYAYAQLLSPSPLNKLGVKIVTPIKGQTFNVGEGANLMVSGTSTYNSTNNCHVSIIVNDIKPYQKAIPTGDKIGQNDYSTWKFILDPAYATVKEGINKITSRLICPNAQGVTTKWYSVNVIGQNNNNHRLLSIASSSIATTSTETNRNLNTVDILPFNKNITNHDISSTLISNTNNNDEGNDGGGGGSAKQLKDSIVSMVMKKIQDSFAESTK